MNMDQQVKVLHYLEEKGFALEDSSPKQMKFVREPDEEIDILINGDSITSKLKSAEEQFCPLPCDFNEFMEILKQRIS